MRFAALICLTIAALAPAAGCAGKAERKAWNAYAERLSPAVGVEKADAFVREWGMPHKQMPLETGRACNWRFSKGSRSLGFAYFFSIGEVKPRYDDVLLIFDSNDVLQEWKVECRR